MTPAKVLDFTHSNPDLTLGNGGATLHLSTTRKLTFTSEDIPTLVAMLNYLVTYAKEHPDAP
jgi:hypothetical protein